jgi:S1-C subfamily serine protease
MTFSRQRAGAETSGLIGGSALLNYRAGIDYAHATVYFDERGSYAAPGIDVVGLTLRPELDGRYTVIGVPEYQGKPAVPDVKAGDVLISIDKVPAKGGTMGQIWSLLGGSPGDTRVLKLEREGKPFSVNATVRRFLPAK